MSTWPLVSASVVAIGILQTTAVALLAVIVVVRFLAAGGGISIIRAVVVSRTETSRRLLPRMPGLVPIILIVTSALVASVVTIW
jgi:hypothetical protein